MGNLPLQLGYREKERIGLQLCIPIIRYYF